MKRAAIIGCGGIAQVHAWALSQMENVEIAAFADVIKERAEQMAEKYTAGKAAVYTAWEAILEDYSIDVIHICTPHYLHVPMAVKAMQNGKAVFMEKPPAITRDQFSWLKQMKENYEGKLGFCLQNRYNRSTKEIDRVLSEGTLGGVKGIRAIVTWRRDEGYYETDWKGSLTTEGGGALINQSVHTLDLCLRYLGSPVKTEASIANHHLQGVIQVEDTVEAWMENADGVRACFYASNGYGADAPVFLEVECEKGRVTLLDQNVVVTDAEGKLEIIDCKMVNSVGKSYWGNGHLLCIRDFYDSLESGERFANDLTGIENTFDTMMKIYEKGRQK